MKIDKHRFKVGNLGSYGTPLLEEIVFDEATQKYYKSDGTIYTHQWMSEPHQFYQAKDDPNFVALKMNIGSRAIEIGKRRFLQLDAFQVVGFSPCEEPETLGSAYFAITYFKSK